MTNIKKPNKQPPIPSCNYLPANAVREKLMLPKQVQQIKTIIHENAREFDKVVNEHLKDGWSILKIEISSGIYLNEFYAVMEKRVVISEEYTTINEDL